MSRVAIRLTDFMVANLGWRLVFESERMDEEVETIPKLRRQVQQTEKLEVKRPRQDG